MTAGTALTESLWKFKFKKVSSHSNTANFTLFRYANNTHVPVHIKKTLVTLRTLGGNFLFFGLSNIAYFKTS